MRSLFAFSFAAPLGVAILITMTMAMVACPPSLPPSLRLSSRPVVLIKNVQLLRSSQFPEDGGPIAHPVRPTSYQKIDNFYTLTVYKKGAQVIRMYDTILGKQGFRKGMDLYFQRHDGQAVTIDDFYSAMCDANDRDLGNFKLWYSQVGCDARRLGLHHQCQCHRLCCPASAQAGTPTLEVDYSWDGEKPTFKYKQVLPSTPGSPGHEKKAMFIPFRFGLLDANGDDIPISRVVLSNGTTYVSTSVHCLLLLLLLLLLLACFDSLPAAAAAWLWQDFAGDSTVVVPLTDLDGSFQVSGLQSTARPVPSMLRSFSAPVILKTNLSVADQLFLLAHDSDAFNRWESGQQVFKTLAKQLVAEHGQAVVSESATIDIVVPAEHIQALGNLLKDSQVDDAFKALCFNLPSVSEVVADIDKADPVAVYKVLALMNKAIAQALQHDLLAVDASSSLPHYSIDAASKGKRALRNTVLNLVASLRDEAIVSRVKDRFYSADNMTDQEACLRMLCG